MNDIHDNNLIKRFMDSKEGDILNIKCPECGANMIVRAGYSKFLGCTNYPECKGKYGLETDNYSNLINSSIIDNCFNGHIESDNKGVVIHFNDEDYDYNECIK